MRLNDFVEFIASHWGGFLPLIAATLGVGVFFWNVPRTKWGEHHRLVARVLRLVGYLVILVTLLTLLWRAWPAPSSCQHRKGPILDSHTGELGGCLDTKLRVTRISYQLENCTVGQPPPVPLSESHLPVYRDSEEHAWKICTAQLGESLGVELLDVGEDGSPHDPRIQESAPKLLAVPEKVTLDIEGLLPNETAQVHIFTDQQYDTTVYHRALPDKGTVTVQIGGAGFVNFLEKKDDGPYRLPSQAGKNMVRATLGPLAIVVVSARDGSGDLRRSAPIALIRSGVRTPNDLWILGEAQLAYVDHERPPLVVFQSVVNCSAPGKQGVFASPIDGSTLIPISANPFFQATLIRTEAGPPARVFFRANSEEVANRRCRSALLDGTPPILRDEHELQCVPPEALAVRPIPKVVWWNNCTRPR